MGKHATLESNVFNAQLKTNILCSNPSSWGSELRIKLKISIKIKWLANKWDEKWENAALFLLNWSTDHKCYLRMSKYPAHVYPLYIGHRYGSRNVTKTQFQKRLVGDNNKRFLLSPGFLNKNFNVTDRLREAKRLSIFMLSVGFCLL